MIAATLLLRSFWDLLNVRLGFDPQSVMMVRTRLPYQNDPKTDVYGTASQEAPQRPRNQARPPRYTNPVAETTVRESRTQFAAAEDSVSTMSVEERTQVLEWFDESHREFVASIEGLSDAQWKWKPGPERWSVGETAEHIVLAEALLFDIVHKALGTPTNPGWEEQTKGKTEFIIRVMPSRQGNAQAPEPIWPRSRLGPEQVEKRFEKQRVEICKFVSETQLALKEHTADHPFPVFGTLNAYQWLMYVPLHSIRHVKQIAEIQATPGYPLH